MNDSQEIRFEASVRSYLSDEDRRSALESARRVAGEELYKLLKQSRPSVVEIEEKIIYTPIYDYASSPPDDLIRILVRVTWLPSAIEKALPALYAALHACQASQKAAVAALLQVEWVPQETDGEPVCPWCNGMRDVDGHRPDCPRQKALKP